MMLGMACSGGAIVALVVGALRGRLGALGTKRQQSPLGSATETL
jgi:fucose permease